MVGLKERDSNITLKLSMDPSLEPGLRPEPNVASIAP